MSYPKKVKTQSQLTKNIKLAIPKIRTAIFNGKKVYRLTSLTNQPSGPRKFNKMRKAK